MIESNANAGTNAFINVSANALDLVLLRALLNIFFKSLILAGSGQIMRLMLPHLGPDLPEFRQLL